MGRIVITAKALKGSRYQRSTPAPKTRRVQFSRGKLARRLRTRAHITKKTVKINALDNIALSLSRFYLSLTFVGFDASGMGLNGNRILCI